MKWSKEQEEAIEKIDLFLKVSGERVFWLFGAAGTGKTTLAKTAVASAYHPVFAAYTGKAAHVLSRKKCPNPSTLHSLLYTPIGDLREEIARLEAMIKEGLFTGEKLKEIKEQIEEMSKEADQPRFAWSPSAEARAADVVVVDECSMLSVDIYEDLERLGKKLLMLGDPFQLPPVRASAALFGVDPDHILTEIHRQGKLSAVLRFAALARDGYRLPATLECGDGHTSRFCNISDLTAEEFFSPDTQVIVGRNKTRHEINDWFRDHLKRKELLEEGDRVICLRNYKEAGLLNGSQWIATRVWEHENHITAEIADEFDNRRMVNMLKGIFQRKDLKEIPYTLRRVYREFDYGYAITAHKAQGSQWDHVIVFDESFVFREQAEKWLYTAITRAAKSVTVIRM